VRRASAALFAVALLAGCATGARDARQSDDLLLAEQVVRSLAGEFAGRVRGDASGGLIRIRVEPSRTDADGAALRMTQRARDAVRAFRITLRPTSLATRLRGEFVPLQQGAAAARGCPITADLRDQGFVIATTAETCRFDRDGRSLGLVKEIAHDGRRLVIADRIVDLDRGEPTQPDRVIELLRVRGFDVWAGRRDGPDEDWRVAAESALLSDGRAVDPVDAGGMPLGLTLELAPYLVGDDAAPVLRLRVFDRDSGRLLGQSWADAGAERLGLGLPAVQIGLRAADPR
jgi:hypothetical protein